MTHPLRRGGALPQVIVALFVLLLLAGLLLPAINSPRVINRTRLCLSNMRQVALATNAFESRSSQSAYPGYKNYLKLKDGTGYKARGTPYPATEVGQEQAVSWLIPLLPYLDQQKLYDTLRDPANSAAADRGTNAGSVRISGSQGEFNQPLYPYIDYVVCPSDPPSSFDRAPVSYVPNTGLRDGKTVGQRDYRANGVFHDHYTDHPDRAANVGKTTNLIETVTSSFIDRQGDGLQFTLLFSENIDAGSYLDTEERFLGMTWGVPAIIDTSVTPFTATALPTYLHRINEEKYRQFSRIADGPLDPANVPGPSDDDAAPYYYYARPSSNHRGGVNVVFCDAHGIFLSDRIDYYVYTLLMTPDGKNVRDPRTGDTLNVDGYSGTSIEPPPFDQAWLLKY